MFLLRQADVFLRLDRNQASRREGGSYVQEQDMGYSMKSVSKVELSCLEVELSCLEVELSRAELS